MSTTITIPSAVDEVVAKVQSRIATFLLCREKLTKLSKNQDHTIGDNASIMLDQQTKLESELSAVLGEITAIRAGGSWGFSDITILGGFYYNLERHIKGTDDLWKKAGGETALTTVNWLMWAGVGIMLLLLVRKRR